MADRPTEPVDAPAETQSTHALASDGKAVLVSRFQLKIVEGPDKGRTFTSTGERTLVGTHASADVILTDNTVSRFHCELVPDRDRLIVRDLGSKNGTVIDGVSVLHGHARLGATLTVGLTRLKIGPRAEDARIELSQRERFGKMVGQSVAIRQVFALLERAAASDATVLLVGETGTGKEAAAAAIHDQGRRKEGPFVVVDCGAIPANLLESELFGHERGSFTGASGPREGAFEAASGGTIFFDEIGELPLDLQVKVLRALDTRKVKRIGSNDYIPVDVRVLAATNRSLRTEVNTKQFRADLYYRLAVIEVGLPPLRERKDDLPLLVDALVADLGATEEAVRPFKSPEFIDELARHAWPGNVRELRNYIERCIFLGAAPPPPDAQEPKDSLPSIHAELPLREARERWVRTLERGYLEAMLAKSNGNVTAAARLAGVDRMHFYRLLWRHGLR